MQAEEIATLQQVRVQALQEEMAALQQKAAALQKQQEDSMWTFACPM